MKTLNKQGIAIVGMGCHFPGGAVGINDFWQLLIEARNAIVEVPKQRWDLKSFHSSEPNTPGKTYTLNGGFLERPLDAFDASFFGFSPGEAASLDPQQRWLLETSWEALENGGQNIDSLRGSSTGVFMGGFCMDHQLQHLGSDNRHLIDGFTSTSSGLTLLANRLSHFYDFEGPSVSLDTACSSSIMALHLACQSIRSGECQQALVGGVNCMIRPEFTIAMSKGRFLSQRGHCMPFDESADGYVRGEGAGVVFIKDLETAISDRDPICSVILSTGANQDGNTPGITLPSSSSQASLLKKVIDASGISPAELDFFEAHGTGTQSGDLAEFTSLTRVLSEGRKGGETCWLGTVKALIGHLEAASGMASLIKTALILKSGIIPPSNHVKRPRTKLDWENSCLQLPVHNIQLNKNETPWFAGINSFGYGGTNAATILQSPPEAQEACVKRFQHDAWILPISAKDPESLRKRMGTFKESLKVSVNEQSAWQSLIKTAGERQTHLSHRTAVQGASPKEILHILQSCIDQSETAHPFQRSRFQEDRGLVFVFSGMGTQWHGMGKQLREDFPVFRDAHAMAVDAICSHGDSVFGQGLDSPSDAQKINQADMAQPAIFSLQYALCALLKDLGIQPSAVIGHSAGEIAAACVSGCLSLEDAARVCSVRSRFQQTLAGKGRMLALSLSPNQIEDLIADYPQVCVAAVNSPQSVTLSGNTEQLETLESSLLKGVFRKFLRVDIPYHSAAMEAIQDPLQAQLRNLKPTKGTIPFYSTVLGNVSTTLSLDAAYWWKNVRATTQFSAALKACFDNGYQKMVEIGAHPVLKNSILETAMDAKVQIETFHTLRRKEEEAVGLGATLIHLYEAGIHVHWKHWQPISGNYVQLPPCPQVPQRFWVESQKSQVDRLGTDGNSFLHKRESSPLPTWQVEINKAFFPYIEDHRVGSQVAFPASGFLEAVFAVHHALFRSDTCLLEKVHFKQMLTVQMDKPKRLFTQYDPPRKSFLISSCDKVDGFDYDHHVTGELFHMLDLPDLDPIDFESLTQSCEKRISQSDVYDWLQERNLHYGPRFRMVQEVYLGQRQCVIRISQASHQQSEPHTRFDPCMLDAVFHGSLFADFESTETQSYIPVSIEKLFLHSQQPRSAWVHARLISASQNDVKVNLDICDDNGKQVMVIEGLCCRKMVSQIPPKGTDKLLHRKQWMMQEATRGNRMPVFFHGDVPDWAMQSRGELCQNGINIIPSLDQVDKDTRIIYFPAPVSAQTAIGSQFFESLDAIRKFPEGHRHSWKLVTDSTQFFYGDELGKPSYLNCLWGISAVIVHEGLVEHCSCVDMDFDDSMSCQRDLINELCSSGLDREVAYRHGKRFRAEIQPMRSEFILSASLEVSEGAYIITGGTQGFGLEVALHLAKMGARNLYLVSRSGGNAPSFQKRKGEFERFKTCVTAVSLDISKEHEVASWMRQLETQKPRIRGIFHAAMVLEDGFVNNVQLDSVFNVMNPKAQGALYLHRYSQHMEIDYFVLFSSVSTLLGNPGQAVYSASNSFLDGLAAYRKRHGLNATSINLGALQESGVLDKQIKIKVALEHAGVAGLANEEALMGFVRALNSKKPQVGLFRVDWQKWQRIFPATNRDTLLRACLGGDLDAMQADDRAITLEGIHRHSEERQKKILQTLLRSVLTPFLKVQPENAGKKANQEHFEVDSIALVEMVIKLNEILPVNIQTVDLISNSSIDTLVQLVLDKLKEQE